MSSTRYCDSPPRSPRHYDKFTYSARRRGETETDMSNLASPSRRGYSGVPSAYEACVAGVAPLLRNSHGFAVAEDGTVQSRFVSAPRWSSPSIAMVPVPMAVMPTQGSVHRILASPPTSPNQIPPVAYHVGVSEIVPSSEVEAWKRFVISASRDFTEDELAQLNWNTVSDLLVHYQVRNPIDVARVQLAWKRRQGMLPSDALDQIAPIGDHNVVYVPHQTIIRYPNQSPPRSSVRTASPRRDSPVRFVPSYKTRMNLKDVSPKIDNGRRSPARSGATPTRARTPTRK